MIRHGLWSLNCSHSWFMEVHSSWSSAPPLHVSWSLSWSWRLSVNKEIFAVFLAYLSILIIILCICLCKKRFSCIFSSLEQCTLFRYDCSTYEQDTKKMVKYMNNHGGTHGCLYLWFIICHMVALAIDFLVVLYFDHMLQVGGFQFYQGWQYKWYIYVL